VAKANGEVLSLVIMKAAWGTHETAKANKKKAEKTNVFNEKWNNSSG
jgi:hypothetical protein